MARQHSREGAIQMAKYFVASTDKAYRTNDPSTIAAISSKSCAGCQGVIDDVAKNKRAGSHQDGQGMRVDAVLPRPTPTNELAQEVVELLIDSSTVDFVKSDGSHAFTSTGKKWTLRVFLAWVAGGWQIQAAGEVRQ
ncbi:DUF6318 family protein [Nostocoides japonicum]|uniref:DUF6318 family protein n=1 Tax=Nostocoides japonicum TaxID=99481 RepID=UPI001F29E29A|nr:DUF6318 family protein [Tetrasphaera japonica]